MRPVPPPARERRDAREPLWRHVVGDVLRRERLARGRTLKDVAEAARISMPYLSEVERGRKEASSEVLAAAAHALDLRLVDLLALAGERLAEPSAAPAPRTAPAEPPRPADGRATSLLARRAAAAGPARGGAPLLLAA
ncbi:helix-turn-helix transcriptional regulator [Streptomyces sp. DSM 44915]|uniref:Helix-turn-helix transcriptional regulator n=1 Tax=Streptomyces chisholmiae TaxID=3075540 RepID=A0ABU2JK41_9ACTN|nr:helix-turn-helix transcriptional regulator [Streptomyces sp. DSM 44915]MDT0265346.1 helix-turn-helix transcriptional regulator [Streptomyces sp. DSM 44915]